MEVVLKTDVLGRVRTPLQRRHSLLEEFERSGLSGAKFAALAGIKYSTFANWLQKRRRHDSWNRSDVVSVPDSKSGLAGRARLRPPFHTGQGRRFPAYFHPP